MTESMSPPKAAAPSSPATRTPLRPFPALGRRGLLVVGLSFAMAYGLSQRFLSLDLGEWRPLGHPFDVKPRPGTGLEQLRQRFGDSRRQIRADLELLELEKASRESEARQRREQAEQERQLREEQQRLERAQDLPIAPPRAAVAEPSSPAEPADPPVASPSEAPEMSPLEPPAPQP